MTLRILYEDDFLIFVDKPPGIVVQRSHDPVEPVLLEEVGDYLRAKGQRAYLMQRLDRGTSGVMFFSKDGSVNAALTRDFEQRRIAKEYLALCEGLVAEPLTIDAPLARIGPISFGVRPEGKRAVTDVTPLAGNGLATLLSIRLRTGRTHQIRVHLASIGHPLVGDWLYGERNASRPMLHAWRLSLSHPRTRVPLVVGSAVPADFLKTATERGLQIDIRQLEASAREDALPSGAVDGEA
jgi:23S rRNA pseudouridine1911/1915/1917 synthase